MGQGAGDPGTEAEPHPLPGGGAQTFSPFRPVDGKELETSENNRQNPDRLLDEQGRNFGEEIRPEPDAGEGGRQQDEDMPVIPQAPVLADPGGAHQQHKGSQETDSDTLAVGPR